MKTLKVKSIVFSLLAIMVVSVFMTSCEQEVMPTPELSDNSNQRMEVVSSEVLAANDVKVAELKTIVESEVTVLGTPQFDMVTLVEYSKPGATALVLPFTDEAEAKSRTLISYFDGGVYTNSFYLEFSPTQAYQEEVVDNADAAYSGEITFYTKNSELIVRNTIKEGVQVENYTNPELRNCMSNCLAGAWNSLPSFTKKLLKAAFGDCVAGSHLGCVVLAAVLGGEVWQYDGNIFGLMDLYNLIQ